MSPVGVNKTIIKTGHNGILALDEIEWFDALSSLIENAQLRRTLGENGRETVIEKYSVEANKHKYLEVFRNA